MLSKAPKLSLGRHHATVFCAKDKTGTSELRYLLASFAIISERSGMPDEILALPEVAQFLKVTEKTVYTVAQKSQLSAFTVRGQWQSSVRTSTTG